MQTRSSTNPKASKIDNGLRRAGRIVGASVDLLAHLVGNVDQLLADVRRDSAHVARQSEALYATWVETAGSVRDTIRATPRFARILREGLTIAARYRIERSMAEVLSEERAAARREALHRSSAERIYQLCVELRGGVLKLGQFASCRMDLLPLAYIEVLAKLQDQVPPVPGEEVVARVEEQLGDGGSVDELFARFDREPIAAASLAQVHSAQLHDGTEVAVKVQVPGIEDVVEVDIAALRLIAENFTDLWPGLDATTFIDELSRSVVRELDYEAEAAQATDFGVRFADDDRVVIPRVIPEYSTGRVLTATLCRGRRLVDYLDAPGSDGDPGAAASRRDQLLATLIDVTCRQILAHGIFHADPHPGNFLVDADDRLVILDFGSVGHLGDGQRRGYARLVGAILAQDREGMARLLGELGFRTESGDAGGLVELAEIFLQVFRDSMATEAGHADWNAVDPRRQFEQAMAIIRSHPIAEVPTSFVMIGRVFGALAGIVLHYRPRVALFPLLAGHLATALAER